MSKPEPLSTDVQGVDIDVEYAEGVVLVSGPGLVATLTRDVAFNTAHKLLHAADIMPESSS